jgi:hypothetical protein
MPVRNNAPQNPKAPRRSPITILIAALLAAAGGLHLAALPSHLGSSVVVGAFFAATALGQLLGAVLIAIRPSARTTVAVIIGNLAVLAIWAVSRTTGLPVGGEVGAPEPLALLDGLAAAAQVLVVAGGLRTIVRRGPVSPRSSPGWQPALVLALAWLLTGGVGISLAEPAHHHSRAAIAPDAPSVAVVPSVAVAPTAHGHGDGGYSHDGSCNVDHSCGGDHHRSK